MYQYYPLCRDKVFNRISVIDEFLLFVKDRQFQIKLIRITRVILTKKTVFHSLVIRHFLYETRWIGEQKIYFRVSSFLPKYIHWMVFLAREN